MWMWERPCGNKRDLGRVAKSAKGRRSLLDMSKFESLLELKVDLCERFVVGLGVRGVDAPRRGVDNDAELAVEVRGVAGNIGKPRAHGTA